MSRLLRVALLLVGAALAVQGCSSESTTLDQQPKEQDWRIQADAASTDQALQGLNYYPSSTLTIDSGDTVTWFPAGEPHTVSFFPAGQPLSSPTDPNNQKPAGGKTFDGSTYTSSGLKRSGARTPCVLRNPERIKFIA